MSDDKPSLPESYTTFEITIPAEEKQNVLAITALSGAYGWKLRQRQTLSSDLERSDTPHLNVVDEDDFLQISEDIWQDAKYGRTAKSFIEAQRSLLSEEWIREGSNSDSQAKTSMYSTLTSEFPGDAQWFDEPFVSYFGNRELPFEKRLITDALEKLWPHTTYPFQTPGVNYIPEKQGEDSWRYNEWLLTPGDVTRDRLAHFVVSRGLYGGDSVGALGKASDIMSVRAGLVNVHEVKEKWAAEPSYTYISYADIENAANAAGLSKNARSNLKREIAWSLQNQVYPARQMYHERGKIVVDGEAVEARYNRARRSHVKYQTIAVESLAGLFIDNGYSEKRNVAVRKFLKDFVKP